jgi:glucose-6-phosphate isomerase
MTPINLTELAVYKTLQAHAEKMQQPQCHLKHLTAADDRLREYSRTGGGLFFDFSRQRLDAKALALLSQLAHDMRIEEFLDRMAAGQKVNSTEQRAALHMAARQFDDDPVMVDGIDGYAALEKVRRQIADFSAEIHTGQLRGSTGRPFTDVVVIGIGGSYLGTEFVATALAAMADKKINLHFLSNVDIHNFGAIADQIDPQTTLWVVISKSYTTAETMANVKQAVSFMESKGIEPAKHLVTVTAKGSPGDDPSKPILRSFHMFDFIGGRYSVTSAVGGVPLSLYLGYQRFEAFLKGANQMDRHALEAPVEENLPMLAALISVWNATFLDYPQAAIIPYATPLAKLAPHIQQLNMESNGKSVTREGNPLDTPCGVIIFGEPGTNAQHSFFQLAHQGRPFPIDFIGVATPQYDQYNSLSRGVSNHQELWANMIAQAAALATGKESSDGARSFPGNRPSSIIVLKDLSPQSVGRLLAFYEAKTVFEAAIWGINPFDQFGVELGKTMASDIRAEMAARNKNRDHRFESGDPIVEHYLNLLFSL